MLRKDIESKIKTIPSKPGVYCYRDDKGEIIYVGKAINLRNRVRSYFHQSANHTHKIRHLVEDIADIEFIVTGSELEALLLENNLIKKHQPKYNVRLKDDRRYPYIKVHWQDAYPKISTTRRMLSDKSRYFGPYTASWAVYQTLDLVRKIYPYLTCTRNIDGEDEKACLYYHIGRCTAPCIGAVTKEEYRATIDNLCGFLAGNTQPVLERLQQEMMQAAENLDFEKAATLRDQIKGIELIVEKQKVVSTDMIDEDVIAFARSESDACVQVFFIRGGKLMGRKYFMMTGVDEASDDEVMTAFLKQFYDQVSYIPPVILLSNEVDEIMIIRNWLDNKRGDKVTVKIPRQSQDVDLINMATENAVETLSHLKEQWDVDESKLTEALTELRECLHLPHDPLRVECYDISTLQGKHTVASMVVFAKGRRHRSAYRRFKIRTVIDKPDDFTSMEEVLRRRLKRMEEKQELGVRSQEVTKDDSWKIIPNLIIVDGGKGQLSAALGVLDEFGLRDVIPVVSLAKREEEIFIPNQSEPIILPRRSQGLYLMQRIRDEAHRFAITYNRHLRRKAGISSLLDTIPGVGPKRRKALLKKFGSVQNIREADVADIATMKGISQALAETIKGML